ncbi:helix-turn-helix domain-containing protein [Pedobacter mendelii]|nr:helix-turn-helix domain-containing protein [Pedobacter mendelii]
MGSNQQKLSFILFQSFTPLYFAAPAFFYLYITGFLSYERPLTKANWLHFIPALLAIIHVIPWPGIGNLDWQLLISQFNKYGYLSLKAKSGLFPPYFHYLFRPLLTIIYLVLSWRAVIKSKILKQSDNDHPRTNWMLFILRVATFFQLMGLTRIILSLFDIPLYNPIFIFLNCTVLLGVLLYALHKPHIFYGSLLIAIDWKKKESPTAQPVRVQSEFLEKDKNNQAGNVRKESRMLPIPFKRIKITDGQLEAYILLMKNAMEVECLFLNPDLQIVDLAGKINVPVHHCSFVINNHLGKNFRDWINGYRVGYFLKQYPLLGAKMTILAIAQEAGFKNQATFYNAFKKEKGIMPTSYIAQELSPYS